MSPTPPALTSAAVASAVGYADGWLAYRRRLARLPGLQAAVWHEDGLVLSTAHGMADVASARPVRTDTLFRIASHSKTFTATAVLQLREAGRLRLDDEVGTWLPALAASPLARRTLADLLGHGGGVVRDGEDADFWLLSRPFPSEAELLAACGDGSAVLPPQQRFKYSNIAYGLLGLVVAAAAGETYQAYVTREVVEHLGLSDTGPELPAARLADCATGYTSLAYAEERLPIDQVGTGALAAATGFYGTAADVCRYASAHFLGDDRLLPDDAKRRMQHELWAVEGADAGYGLGLSVRRVGDRRMVGHDGGWPGHITRTLLDPDARLAVSVFTNAVDGPAGELASGVVRLVDLAAAQAAQDEDADATVRARFCGRYANLWGVLDVADLGGRLVGLRPADPDPAAMPVELRVEDDATLRITGTAGYGAPGETLRFRWNDDNDRGDRDNDGGGAVREVRGNGGMAFLPLAAHQAALRGVDRIAAPPARASASG